MCIDSFRFCFFFIFVCFCFVVFLVIYSLFFFVFFFFKQKTAYEMRISDWSSDVCSSDLLADLRAIGIPHVADLVALMYPPEFSPEDDVAQEPLSRTLDRARNVVATWS